MVSEDKEVQPGHQVTQLTHNAAESTGVSIEHSLILQLYPNAETQFHCDSLFGFFSWTFQRHNSAPIGPIKSTYSSQSLKYMCEVYASQAT